MNFTVVLAVVLAGLQVVSCMVYKGGGEIRLRGFHLFTMLLSYVAEPFSPYP